MSSKTVWQKAARRLQRLTGCSYQYALNLVQTPSVKIEAQRLKDLSVINSAVISLEDALVKAASAKVTT